MSTTAQAVLGSFGQSCALADATDEALM